MTLVFDNIVYSLQRSGGVSRFWSEITAPFLSNARFIERGDATDNLYRRFQSPVEVLPDHCLPKALSRYVNFRSGPNDDRYIFHSSYYRVNTDRHAINVTTIHDLIYERFSRKGLGHWLHLEQKRRSLAAADCIVCVSEHTRKDLFAYYPFTLNKRVLVIPNGVDTAPFVENAHPVDCSVREATQQGDFFLYVGNRGSCKGFDRVYQALKLCGAKWRCVIVGDPLQEHERKQIAREGLNGQVISVGRVSDSELNFLYRHASFFFFPSLYEGFGIPPLEAMQQGCPVLATDRSSVPEVVGNAGVLFNPDDIDSLKEGLARIMSQQLKDNLVLAGRKRAMEFSWTSTVGQYRELYSELLDDQ